MAVSGLVVTLASENTDAEPVLNALRHDPRFIPGERKGSRIPLVMDTDSVRNDRDGVEYLANLPGVVNVDVVYIGFPEGDAGSTETSQPVSQQQEG